MLNKFLYFKLYYEIEEFLDDDLHKYILNSRSNLNPNLYYMES